MHAFINSKFMESYEFYIEVVTFQFCTLSTFWPTNNSGLLIIRGKKSEISRDLKRQIRGENGRFRGIFAGIFGPNFR